LLEIDGKEIVLEEGDSIYFDATKPHGMKALNNEKARFLAIIL
jgi:quercetin dioxygenase-like cupin family protein